MRIEGNIKGERIMKESKLLLSQFANEEGFELTKYLNTLFEYVSQQIGQTATIKTEADNT